MTLAPARSTVPPLSLLLAGLSALAPATTFLFFPFTAVGAIVGVIGLVLAIRDRRAGARGPLNTIPLVVAPIAVVANVVIFVVALSLLIGPIRQSVRVDAGSTNGFTGVLTTPEQSKVHDWPITDEDFWWETSTTSYVVFTAYPLPGETDAGAWCNLTWNGELVVEESSTSGPVTCRYPER